MAVFFISSFPLCKSRTRERKIKSLHIVMREENNFYIHRHAKAPILGCLQHPIDSAGSTTLFSSDPAFPSVSLSAKKLKLFVNDSDSKENENKANVTG